MATTKAIIPQEPAEINLPKLPTEVKDFIPYLSKNPNSPIKKLLDPFKAFESELRKVYAQDPSHEAVKDPNVNLVPVFNGHEGEIKIRARDLNKETEEEKSHFIMSLNDEERKKTGSPAVVSSFKGFQNNFNLFSESSLTDLDWSNVVAAGSSVTSALLPVPEEWAGSKRQMREYYHEHLAPASDVDLFLYGMSEKQALEEIKQIEQRIKDSILHEVTTIRTKNAITIASQHPTRHVQIVLRLYDSISQIITGFDVDCACAAYDGKQVYAAPRALAAFMTQCNTIDLTRRSPSYENRVSKYSHRGFEVHWPLLDRNRIDPTIFERSFGRTQGLARLLILEKLPKTSDRDSYMAKRREERGRPKRRIYSMNWGRSGNLKDEQEDEVADWVQQEDVSSYHTMTVPYGPKYHAARINRLLYARDLLLNAEWNQPKDREVYLHRHPCFFGTAEEVFQDCCGYCPTAKTDEEIEVAEEEAKMYVSGELVFIKDDPGRQEIGSFNPITDDEWTTMAYVGDTARLCQAIVDGDLEHVQDWCAQEAVDVNRRDYTGRTPLHLATMVSTPEIVQCLIDHRARLVARLVDGRTALHIAAARGNVVMVKALMDKSLENDLEEYEKKTARRKAKRERERKLQGSEEDEEEIDEASTLNSEDSDSLTMGSYVKVDTEMILVDGVPDDSTEDPDIYEIDVIAWDYGLSPLHLAILNGHLNVIKLLVSDYGSDVLLPVKLVDPHSKSARGAIMTIVLAMFLPADKAKPVLELLLELGATSGQGDMNHITAFHYLAAQGEQALVDVLLANDAPVVKSVLNNIGFIDNFSHIGVSPLLSAVKAGHAEMVSKLISIGAKPTVTFDDWVKLYLEKNPHAKHSSTENNIESFRQTVTQPVICAANREMSSIVNQLIDKGADPATITSDSHLILKNPVSYSWLTGETVLDIIQKKIRKLREYLFPGEVQFKAPEKLRDATFYLAGLTEGTYQYWTALHDFEAQRKLNDTRWEDHRRRFEQTYEVGIKEKHAAVAEVLQQLETTEKWLIAAGAKSFYEMHPMIAKPKKGNSFNYTPPESQPYKTVWHVNVPDMNPAKKDGYLRLFEAAWKGDLEKIKAMTLAPWSSDQEPPANDPFQIAVTDQNGFSPFSISVLRGHLVLAKQIIDICKAQYHKGDSKVYLQRWNIATENSEDSNDSDDDENVIPISSEPVNYKFTVDNLGEVSNIAKSSVIPLSMIEWPCMAARFNTSGNESAHSLLEHAVEFDNLELLKFIIKLATEQKCLLAQEDDDQRCYTIDRRVFHLAIKHGRTALLAEMIESTGAGIPLNELIEKSGVEIKTKPSYYQGLTVSGKKRADWAKAPDNNVAHAVEVKNPPLLQAAYIGSIESLEWFMSDAPMRRYKQFGEKNKNDKRIKSLEESGKGFDNTIATWLNKQNELVLHCAILWSPREDTKKYLALIEHLLTIRPEYLEQNSAQGYTPLQTAVLLNRVDVVKYLISIGAHQRSRDRTGRNMVHSMIISMSTSSTNRADADRLNAMIALFDKTAVKEMLLERATTISGPLTPLALWMKTNVYPQTISTSIIEILSNYSTGEDLEMIDGKGDLPLHVAVKEGLSSITSFLINRNPTLLYRENSTGRTPLEMSRDVYIASCVEKPINIGSWHERNLPSVIDKNPIDFLPNGSNTTNESKKRTFEICIEADAKMIAEDRETKRRIVSLFEANQVAKRVGANSRYGGTQMVVNGGIVDMEDRSDVVTEFLGIHGHTSC